MNMATEHLNTSPLTQLLQRQRSSYLAAPNPNYATRVEQLTRLKAAILQFMTHHDITVSVKFLNV